MDEFETVAVEACEAAGDYLVAEFERAETTADYGPRDVKAEADRGAEDRALDVIAGAFPDHAVYGEERGERPGVAIHRDGAPALRGEPGTQHAPDATGAPGDDRSSAACIGHAARLRLAAHSGKDGN